MYRSLQKYFLILFLAGASLSEAQVNFTANDTVPPFSGDFAYGSNMGYYPAWDDMQLADIAAGNPDNGVAGVGIHSLRPALPEHFLEQWGYDVRLEEFAHYASLNIRNNTIFIGYPSDAHKDQSEFCPGTGSEVFANMHLPIWDAGENGTPVNDDNYYALYLYRMVTAYKDYAKYWEISNEPDFDYTNHAWLPPGEPGNWWDNNPDPCQNALKAPVFYYVRMLRISYEVIKTIDPEAYVAIGGLGYPSFLDAVLRNTDNPDDGLITSEYPLKGGAYFDCMSFHSYPHIDGSLRYWDNDIDDFVYTRHSDAAAEGVVILKKEFQGVLENYGYGQTYPEKPYIITEVNIPRVAFGNYIGSDDAQCNFIIKMLVEVQKEKVAQICVFNLGETKSESEASSEFQLMGLYKNLNDADPYQQILNQSGIAFKTTSTLLDHKTYDPVQTNDLLFPDGVNGAAFKSADDEYTYVLWAETKTDMSELSTQSYSFPPFFNADSLYVKEWNFSETGTTTTILSPQIQLTGAPVFITVKSRENAPPPPGVETEDFFFSCFPNPYAESMDIVLKLETKRKISLAIFDVEGHELKTFVYRTEMASGAYLYKVSDDVPPGVYFCRLEVGREDYYCKFVRIPID